METSHSILASFESFVLSNHNLVTGNHGFVRYLVVFCTFLYPVRRQNWRCSRVQIQLFAPKNHPNRQSTMLYPILFLNSSHNSNSTSYQPRNHLPTILCQSQTKTFEPSTANKQHDTTCHFTSPAPHIFDDLGGQC